MARRRAETADVKYSPCLGFNHTWSEPEPGPGTSRFGVQVIERCSNCGTTKVCSVNRHGQVIVKWRYDHPIDWQDRTPGLTREDYRGIYAATILKRRAG